MCTSIRLVAMLLMVLPLAGAVGQTKMPQRQWEIKHTTLPTVREQQFPDNHLVQAGFLPVTLYGADATGERDSTEAIRAAIRAAYENGLACFFPPGTYLVSGQLECQQPRDRMTQAHVLDRDSGKGLLESLAAEGSDRANNTASLFKLGHARPIPIRP